MEENSNINFINRGVEEALITSREKLQLRRVENFNI